MAYSQARNPASIQDVCSQSKICIYSCQILTKSQKTGPPQVLGWSCFCSVTLKSHLQQISDQLKRNQGVPKRALKEKPAGSSTQRKARVYSKELFKEGEYSLDGPPAPHASLGGQTLSPPVLPTTGRPALTVLPNHGTSGTTTTAGAGALHPVSTLHSLRCSLCTRFHLTLNHNQHSVSVMYIPALTSLLTTYTLH